MIVTVDKPVGWTPLEAMEALRARDPALAGVPMVYAGRLDPMAHGLMLVLTGEDRHALPEHLEHDKDYVATFLFGLRSDTHDVLGRVDVGRAPEPERCRAAVAALEGAHALPLPAWSAYRVRGRALHAWARAGRLHEVTVPVRTMRVDAVDEVRVVALDARAAAADATARIAGVRGDFRQPEALADWARLSAQAPEVCAVTATLTVSSGTYVRALAEALGRRLGCGALLYALERTRIGPYRGG